MALNSLTPFGPTDLFAGGVDSLLSLHREMNRLFDDVWRGASGQGGALGQRVAGQIIDARVNVSETQAGLRITAELPGVSQDDIDVRLDEDRLTIRGEKKFEQTDGGKENYHFVERSYGSFQRSLRLPFRADPEQVSANFENGVLTVTVPRSANQQTARRIEIQGEGRRRLSGNGGGREDQNRGRQGEKPEANQQASRH